MLESGSREDIVKKPNCLRTRSPSISMSFSTHSFSSSPSSTMLTLLSSLSRFRCLCFRCRSASSLSSCLRRFLCFLSASLSLCFSCLLEVFQLSHLCPSWWSGISGCGGGTLRGLETRLRLEPVISSSSSSPPLSSSFGCVVVAGDRVV